MKKFLLTLTVIAALAGCASSVPLTEPPVSDAKATQVYPNAAMNKPGANAGNVGARQVEPVKLDNSAGNMAGPTGVGRVVYFDYDSSSVKPEFQGLIESNAKFIKGASGRKVVIEGNTDERGGREYNLALGQKRAEAVRQALGLLGVPDNQVEAVSYGKEKPVDTGSSEESFARNRRAEIAYR
jgi:peptidoglycan-associated lipoprotein